MRDVSLVRSRRLQTGLLLAALGLRVATSHAEPAPAPFTAPVLVDFAQAEYPSAALSGRIEASVVLRLDIDREGHVTAASVAEPVGHGFDEAARAAALRFTFIPARRGDTALASRILYRYDFALPKLPAPAASDSPGPPREVPPPLQANQREAPEVVVRGVSPVERQRQSAEAVTVLETESAQRATHDLGEVLARSEGVSVRRDGGLGSDTRFSLNGLTGDQVRFFVDAMPLEFSGYSLGIANIPVNLVTAVEIYNGVVPVRFGADALGGAVNLVTGREVKGTHAALSYEAGAFDTHRFTLSARHHDPTSGLFARVNGFADFAKNDYPIDVAAPDAEGQPLRARVHRFHDAYRAAGGNLEFGVVGRRFAKRLVLRVFGTAYDKQLQHNFAMKVPYGGVSYGESALGESLRYEQPLGRGVALEVLAAFSRTRGHFLDVSSCIYDWFGRCIGMREPAGETDARPHDQVRLQHAGFGRVNLVWLLSRQQVARFSTTLNHAARSGDERSDGNSGERDPLSGRHQLTSWVSGLEHTLTALDERLENIIFGKHYLQALDAEEPQVGGGFERTRRRGQRFGLGDGVRYRVTPWLYTKLSYEWATRLPRPDEVFGDNAFIVANAALAPETSQNLNASLSVEGRAHATLTGFLRDTDRLIVLVGNERVQSYENVLRARAVGVEVSGGWTSPGEYVVLDANATYQDFRNTSRGGTFGKFVGDRIPNRPYLFGNAGVRLQFRDAAASNDEVALFWNARYVHEFFRSWESVGLRSTKQTLPSQLVQSAGIGYRTRGDGVRVSSTLEVQNLTDGRVYDFFGVQRPGRAVFVKTTADF
jgi:vitamin B12 transporter